MSIYRRNDCRLCGSTDLELVLLLTPTPPGDSYLADQDAARGLPEYPVDLFLCRDCGYVHLRDVLDPEEIYPDYLYVTESSLGLQRHFAAYADEALAKTGFGNGDLAVDIGSNDGTLLRAFKERGCTVLGIDPAREIARRATEAGTPTVGDYFTGELGAQLAEEHRKAPLITVNNCLANLDDLDDILNGVTALLADDGVFVIEFAYLLDLVNGMIFDYIYHEHLSYFSLKPLARFLRKHGLEPFDRTLSDSKGGSMRLYVKRIGHSRAVEPAIEESLREEEAAGIHSPATYADFARHINEQRDACREVLDRWKNEGHPIAGYGASVTSTSLIYHFGFGDYLDFLLDDNPAKIGRFSPGLGLPVKSGTTAGEDTSLRVVILAWRYDEPILSRNQTLLHPPERVLVPLPIANFP